MLGFGPIGALAVGTGPSGGITITAVVVDTAHYTVAANAVTFHLTENISPAAFVVAPQGVTEKQLEAASAASFAVTTRSVSAEFFMPVATAAYVVTANPTTELESDIVAPAAFAVTFNDVPLVWTGAGVDTSYSGGVGHFLYERERAKQLAAITRTIPPAIDRRTAPQFAPLARPYSAPTAPAVDLQAAQNQRLAAQAAQAKAQRKRRDEEVILLLAS